MADQTLRVKRMTDNATLPVRASLGAAGYDLSSAYDYVIPANGKELVKTDLIVMIPVGHYGRIAPRSSLAWKNYIGVGAGVIDPDYRGNVGVILFNHSSVDFVIKKGDRVAQLLLEKISTLVVIEVSNTDETARGSDGFGSTGKNKLDVSDLEFIINHKTPELGFGWCGTSGNIELTQDLTSIKNNKQLELLSLEEVNRLLSIDEFAEYRKATGGYGDINLHDPQLAKELYEVNKKNKDNDDNVSKR